MPTCWKCHRDLGPMLEHQKMVTEKGPLCYACFNALQEEAHQAEQTRRAAERAEDSAS
jgi:hypothetical protein